eukprot:CAMPEP_0115855218 /NCGR_PEP_ID=MMETSP0287-20121206/14429_1 /TAXON_ID=412157 /ORGANISM="Chrysochromulina rotalis, Strain UIO044" /LENGTH=229 /DNA_ID=CAMNT_0003309365 /DNA_START=32 /DNA_END=719 /DNA_ORIENTATION=-
MAIAATGDPVAQLIAPASLQLTLGEAMTPGVRVITLINRSGMLISCVGEPAASISAIVSSLWQSHEKCEGQGGLGCLLLECEYGRLAIKAVGSFILACCSDATVPFGLLKAKVAALHDFLLPSLQAAEGRAAIPRMRSNPMLAHTPEIVARTSVSLSGKVFWHGLEHTTFRSAVCVSRRAGRREGIQSERCLLGLRVKAYGHCPPAGVVWTTGTLISVVTMLDIRAFNA